MKTNIAMLGNWIHSWIQPDGAIYGFHNHSVWGGNPYRWNDFSSGHSVWSSPFLAGLSQALNKRMNAEGLQLLRKLIHFQYASFQENGLYNHIGFQVGETLKHGLIHNAMGNLSLGLTALYGKAYLPSEDMDSIRLAILRNMEACQMYGKGRADLHGCANQEYARIWAKLIFQVVYRDFRWKDEIVQDLDFMLRHFHVEGLPDADSEGALRVLSDPDTIEPAEYYGLMIAPLILAYEVYGEERYLRHAGALCKQVARSSWVDDARQRRFHRLWYRIGERFVRINSPMLIAGMGDTLYGMLRYVEHSRDSEITDFILGCEATYAFYQNPRGYFASATGWQSEIDVAPGTGWHAHDFHYLAVRDEIGPDFWNTFFSPYLKTSVLLGDQCFWIEKDFHWSIADYETQDVFMLLGSKRENVFGRDIPSWIGKNKDQTLPDHFRFPGLPVFIKTDEGIYLKSASSSLSEKYDMTSIAAVPYRGWGL